MPFRRLFKPAALALSLACAAGPAALADPAMWRVSDADSEIYLFGSIHLLQPGMDWRTPQLDELLSDADTFYYELPMANEDAASTQALVQQYGLLPAGQSLLALLSPEQTAQLERVAGRFGLSAAQLDTMQPWFAATNLTLISAMAQGFNANSGVDRTLAQETEDSRERALETMEQQLRIFADMTQEVQLEALLITLDQIENEPDMLNSMISAWADGDVAALETVLLDAAQDSDPAFYAALFTDRNAAWTREIEAMLESSGKTLIIVGAGHLVGDEGVPQMLQDRGITVERVQ